MIFYFNGPFLQVEKQVQKGKVTGPKLASTQLIIRSHDAELGKVLEIHAESFKEKWVYVLPHWGRRRCFFAHEARVAHPFL